MKYRVTHHFNKPDTHIVAEAFYLHDNGCISFYNGDYHASDRDCIAVYKSWRSIHLCS